MSEQGMMQDKVVVVTGAGRGIGRDIALLMAAEGARVVVNDLGGATDGSGSDQTPAEGVVQEIIAKGGQAVANYESVASWASAHRIIECALDNFGRIDSVVNNAGILRDVMFHKMTEEQWHAVIDVHLNGAFYVSRAAAEHFRNQESSSYVHMTSTSGLIGNLGQSNYSAAKLGIAALSKSIALDMRRYNSRSNCIAPFAWSRMIGSIPTETPAQQARVKRLQTMETAKIAPVVVYLASDAAKDVTGQIFAVRSTEIFLMSQPRPVRGIHRGEGWTPQTVAEHAMPALRSNFVPLDVSADIFSWDPV
jgi:NAD(P)-dependent dehydrogenase (short-subunit alcohol dehydrogenase family)